MSASRHERLEASNTCAGYSRTYLTHLRCKTSYMHVASGHASSADSSPECEWPKHGSLIPGALSGSRTQSRGLSLPAYSIGKEAQ